MAEMATAVKYNLPVKILVFKNNYLAEVRWEQIVLTGYPEYGVELQPIDSAKVAGATSAAGFTISQVPGSPCTTSVATTCPAGVTVSGPGVMPSSSSQAASVVLSSTTPKKHAKSCLA